MKRFLPGEYEATRTIAIYHGKVVHNGKSGEEGALDYLRYAISKSYNNLGEGSEEFIRYIMLKGVSRTMQYALLDINPNFISHIPQTIDLCMHAVNNFPGAIKHIHSPHQKVSIKAITNDPYTIEHVPQTRFLCRLAMEKNADVYLKINTKFRTYEYYMKWKKEEQVQAEIIEAIKTEVPPPLPDLDFMFGIEIEFATRKSIEEIYLLLKKFIDVEIRKSVTNKWTIHTETSGPDMYEVTSKVLCSKRDITDLYRICRVLEMLQRLGCITNNPEYCGLHLHIDASSIGYDEVINVTQNYCFMQPAISKLVCKGRRNNSFCEPLDDYFVYKSSNLQKLHHTTYKELRDIKFWAFNPYAYFYNSTIEFRQHESTFDFTDIMYWLYIAQLITNKKNLNRYTYFLNDFFNVLNVDRMVRKHYINKYTY